MNINLKENREKISNYFFKNKEPNEKTSSGFFKARQAPILGLFFVLILSLFVPTKNARALDPLGWLKDTLGDVGKDILNVIIGGLCVIIYNIGNFFLNLAGQFVHFAAFLVDVMMDQNIYRQVLTSGAIQVGWETIRDFCNMFFIFFLLIIAFATILRISEYSAKNILPKFLIAIFMINFSMEIAKLVIDFGQVFMYEIRSWMGTFSGSSGGAGGLTGITDYFNDYFNYSLTSGSTPDAAIAILFAAAYSFTLGLTYIMLAGFLLIRLVMFAILLIISPFAFFGAVMPSTRRYWNEWWGSLIKYALFGPIFIFFVYISATMAFELTQAYNTAAVQAVGGGYDRVEALKDFLPTLIPNIVALMMLWAVVPITQRLGVAGSNRLIGGTAGLGAVAMGSWGAAKLAGGWGKKAIEAPASRLHAWQMGKGGAYKETVDKISGGLKKLPLGTGRVFIKYEAEKQEKHKEEVAKHEKIMDNLTSKDKKAYVDSFQLDRKGKADATQAMFNLLAKDAGKGLTDTRLKKMGYEKNGVFDKEAFIADYNRVKAYGHDTENLETYRPDLIEVKGDVAKTKQEKEDKVAKIVHDGKEKSIKLSALEDKTIADKLEELIGRKKYDNLINNKSQEEKDELAEHKESNLARRIKLYTTNPAHPEALNIATPAGQAELMKSQQEIAGLIKSELKKDKMRDVIGLDANGNLDYSPNVNIELAQNVINKMTKDQFLDLDTEFLKDYGHMIADTNIEHIAKFGEAEQLDAMKRAVEDALAGVRVAIPTRLAGASGIATMNTRLTKIKKKLA